MLVGTNAHVRRSQQRRGKHHEYSAHSCFHPWVLTYGLSSVCSFLVVTESDCSDPGTFRPRLSPPANSIRKTAAKESFLRIPAPRRRWTVRQNPVADCRALRFHQACPRWGRPKLWLRASGCCPHCSSRRGWETGRAEYFLPELPEF